MAKINKLGSFFFNPNVFFTLYHPFKKSYICANLKDKQRTLIENFRSVILKANSLLKQRLIYKPSNNVQPIRSWVFDMCNIFKDIFLHKYKLYTHTRMHLDKFVF